MELQLPCAKGCGGFITVGDEQIEQAKENNVPLVVQHEVCPSDKYEGSIYRIVIQVWRQRQIDEARYLDIVDDADTQDRVWAEDRDTDSGDSTVYFVDELLTSVGAKAEGSDFKSSTVKLSQELNDQWNRVVTMADVIDGD